MNAEKIDIGWTHCWVCQTELTKENTDDCLDNFGNKWCKSCSETLQNHCEHGEHKKMFCRTEYHRSGYWKYVCNECGYSWNERY